MGLDVRERRRIRAGSVEVSILFGTQVNHSYTQNSRYTNDKPLVLSNANVGRIDVPELLRPADDVDHLDHLMENVSVEQTCFTSLSDVATPCIRARNYQTKNNCYNLHKLVICSFQLSYMTGSRATIRSGLQCEHGRQGAPLQNGPPVSEHPAAKRKKVSAFRFRLICSHCSFLFPVSPERVRSFVFNNCKY